MTQYKNFQKFLLDIADDCIPKTSTYLKRSRPWFNDECKASIKERRAAVRKFTTRPTSDNLQKVKIFKAKARRTIRQAKKKSWQSYVSKINYRTSIKSVWNMIRKINGKSVSTVNHLKKENGQTVTGKKQLADTLAETFSKNSSSSNYANPFQNIKKQKEKKKLNFKSNNAETYNQLFSLTELHDSLDKSNDTAVGPDNIHYQLLKHLPKKSKKHYFRFLIRFGNLASCHIRGKRLQLYRFLSQVKKILMLLIISNSSYKLCV